MKKLAALGVALAAVPFALADVSRGAAAYVALQYDCTQMANGAYECTKIVDNSGVSAIVVFILAGIGIWLWQKKK